MAAGFQLTTAEINSRLVAITRGVFASLGEVEKWYAYMEGFSDATLQATPISYPSGDTATMRSAYRDLRELSRLFNGFSTSRGTLSGSYDFTQFTKQVIGGIY